MNERAPNRTMGRGRIVTKTVLLLLGVGLVVSACATESVGYGPDYYGYYGYYGDDGVVFAPGGGRFHGHGGHDFAHGHGGFAHGGFAGHGFGGGMVRSQSLQKLPNRRAVPGIALEGSVELIENSLNLAHGKAGQRK